MKNKKNEVVYAEKSMKTVREIYEWLEILAISATFVLLLFAFVARLAVVSGDSMENTLTHGDALIISNLFYEPKTGDIVVVQVADTTYDELRDPIVKRVIATGGQKVEIDYENWTVTVDGVPLEEPYVKMTTSAMRKGDFVGESFVVPDGKLFIMGDNRNDSWDSRFDGVGFVDERFVLGRLIFRLFPLAKIGTVS